MSSAESSSRSLHQQILELAGRQKQQRMARFASVGTPVELESLQQTLRRRMLELIDGLPDRTGAVGARTTGHLEGDGYVIEKLVLESLPGYWMTCLLYRPTGIDSPRPGIISPCGHSSVGKAAATYQTLHMNLVKRGHVVLTYDPVGQGERSQFWDPLRQRSRFNLVCGEHCVLGNPLYLLGTSLARFRIWDGIRAIDYLSSLPEVDAARIGCIGNSGGGTLTAYISALDPRVRAAVIGCYITSLPHRMGNRIEEDPDADPEQDIFGFVEREIDHAGLLAMIAPRPTLICAARADFFPIEGTRETFEEVHRLYRVAGAADRLRRVEADGRHGLSLPLREAAYGWFERWLRGGDSAAPSAEATVTPRSAEQLAVCADGQVSGSLGSRSLLPLALEEFRHRQEARSRPRRPLRALLQLDLASADYRVTDVSRANGADQDLVLLVNGIDAPDWREEAGLLGLLAERSISVSILDPRGVGPLRDPREVRGHDYGDPMTGVEENLAYNAFLVGRSLLGMRVSDVLAAARELAERSALRRMILCGRRDAGLVTLLAAAVERRIDRVALEETRLSYLPLFDAQGVPINASELAPGLLRDFGDIPDVLAQIAPRNVLAAACSAAPARPPASVRLAGERFSANAEVLLDWLG